MHSIIRNIPSEELNLSDKETTNWCCMLVNTFTYETIPSIAVIASTDVASMCVSTGGIGMTVVTSSTFVYICMKNRGDIYTVHTCIIGMTIVTNVHSC